MPPVLVKLLLQWLNWKTPFICNRPTCRHLDPVSVTCRSTMLNNKSYLNPVYKLNIMPYPFAYTVSVESYGLGNMKKQYIWNTRAVKPLSPRIKKTTFYLKIWCDTSNEASVGAVWPATGVRHDTTPELRLSTEETRHWWLSCFHGIHLKYTTQIPPTWYLDVYIVLDRIVSLSATWQPLSKADQISGNWGIVKQEWTKQTLSLLC